MKCEACGHINETRKKATLPNADFDRFWKEYPKKTGKFLANKFWKAIQGDHVLIQIIISSLERQRRSIDWQKDNGAYIPHASTWLHQRRWEDEVPENGKIVHLSASQSPEMQAKAQQAKERLAAIAQKEWDRRELVRLAQERDDARSRKMAEASGEKEDSFEEFAVKVAQTGEIRKIIARLTDENSHKWVEDLERSESSD